MYIERLRTLRESLGISQKDFAASLGLSKSTYNNYETGVREPRTDLFEKIADKYNVTIDYLIGRSDDPAPPMLNIPPVLQKVKFAFGIKDDDDISQNSLNVLAGVYKTLMENEEKDKGANPDDNET